MIAPHDFLILNATYPAFECCGCSTLSAAEVEELELLRLAYTEAEVQRIALTMGDRPLHLNVLKCRACDHYSCAAHLIRGLCIGCEAEGVMIIE